MNKLQEFKVTAKALNVPNHTFQRFEKIPCSIGEWVAVYKNNINRFKKFTIQFDGDDTVFPQTEYMAEPDWYPIAEPITIENGFEIALQECLKLAEKYL